MYLLAVAVEGDGEAEGVEDASPEFGIGVCECVGEIGEAVEDLAGVIDVECARERPVGCGRGEAGCDLVLFGFEGFDSTSDEVRVDASLDGAELKLDPVLDVLALSFEAFSLVVVGVSDLGCEGRVLASEVGDSVGAEDVVGEEAVDHVGEHVFANVLPLAVAECFGCCVSVADAVGAGVVRDALAFLAVHAERVVAGGAVDDASELVEAPLLCPSFVAFAVLPLLHFGGDPFVPLVGNDRLVALLGFDPFVVGALYDGAFADPGASKVESVPVEAAGVDGVGEDGADSRLRPLPSCVAAAVDVPGWWGAAGSVEVVGYLAEPEAGQVALVDLDDDGRLFWVGDEAGLAIADSGACGIRVRFPFQPVAVGGAAAVSVALAGVLGLAAACFSAEFLDLELVEGLEDVSDEASFGAGLVAGCDGVVDVDVGAGEFSFEGESSEEVTGEARGGVDDDGVEAAGGCVPCLTNEVGPGGSVVATSAFLVGELSHDAATELLDLAHAGVSL